MTTQRHEVRVVVEGQTIDGWTEYEIATSMIEPADGFTMRRPFDPRLWGILRRDARVRVMFDGAPVLDGFIDGRRKRSKEGTIEIRGRDRAGRLVQESAPRITYEGLELTEAIRRLADPWFTKITLTDARNRSLRMGKGRRRVPAGNEPIIVKRSASGAGKVQPGTMRWAIIEELCSQAGLIAWSSADGRELFVGRPNHGQAPSFHILKARAALSGLSSNCIDLQYDEDNGDRYSLIGVVGTGGGTERDFGMAVSSRRAIARDNDDAPDGTGRDFIYPKRLLMPEAQFTSIRDADRVAEREMMRRNFRAATWEATMRDHGQWYGPAPTIYAPNTVAMITDEDFDPPMEETAMITACTYRRARAGDTTTIELVPTGTEVVL